MIPDHHTPHTDVLYIYKRKFIKSKKLLQNVHGIKQNKTKNEANIQVNKLQAAALPYHGYLINQTCTISFSLNVQNGGIMNISTTAFL